jgi:hypothetical protein
MLGFVIFAESQLGIAPIPIIAAGIITSLILGNAIVEVSLDDLRDAVFR